MCLLVLRDLTCLENIPHTLTRPACAVDTRHDGAMASCCLHQILTLPLAWRNRNQDSSPRRCFSTPQLSSVGDGVAHWSRFCWFLVDRSGTWCGRLLQHPIRYNSLYITSLLSFYWVTIYYFYLVNFSYFLTGSLGKGSYFTVKSTTVVFGACEKYNLIWIHSRHWAKIKRNMQQLSYSSNKEIIKLKFGPNIWICICWLQTLYLKKYVEAWIRKPVSIWCDISFTELIRLLIVACGMLSHSSSSCWILEGTGTRCRTCRSIPNMLASMQATEEQTFSAFRNCIQILVTWGHALSCWKTRWWRWVSGSRHGISVHSNCHRQKNLLCNDHDV
jgi:hypothetical protein